MVIRERLPQLRVKFQPICLPDGHLVFGYEAFISDKWETPAPCLYEQAAQSKSLSLLEKISFSKICREFSQNGIGGKLFVNLYAESLAAGSLSAEAIGSTLGRFDIDPNHVVIELQELAPTRRPESLLTSIDKLKERGIQIALDGFGFGFNNFGRLLEIKPHYIKIDARYFVNENDARKQTVLTSLLQLCTCLDVCVIAKNVESADIANLIRCKTGLQLLQGDYFGRPQKVADDENKKLVRTKLAYREALSPFLASYFYGGV